MAPYRLLIKKSAEREFAALPKKDQQRLLMKIRQLEMEPHPRYCEKLTGSGDYRIRQGDYRVVLFR